MICLAGQVFLYNKLVDVLPKHQLFYVVGGFYFVLFSGIAVMLADPVIGLKNDQRDPARLIGEEIEGTRVPSLSFAFPVWKGIGASLCTGICLGPLGGVSSP